MTSSERLIARYSDAEKELIDIIAKKEARGNVTAYHKSLLRQVRAALNRLRRDTPSLTRAVVEDGYRLGLSQSKADNSTAFSILDERQVALLEMNMQTELLRGVNLVGRHMEDALRAAALEANAQKITTGQTVKDMQKKLAAALTGAEDNALVHFEDDKVGVRYRNGRVVALSKYTAMVSRTTTAEAATRADLQRGEDWGCDLCICNAFDPTCGICAMYAGRTYATTREAANGKYYGLRFPYLYDTALNRGYQVIHPSCKHNFTSISADAYTEAELTKMSQRSMRPFEDNRSERERKAYAKTQSENRRRRQNEIQYEQLRAVLPDTAYKSFGAFLSAKNANSERYQDMMKDYRYVLKSIANSEGDGIISAGGEAMNVLPNADKAIIPVEKLTQYSLDFDKDPNKAKAFETALGYTKKNAEKLIENIYSNVAHFETVPKGNNGYGDIYEAVMNIVGENGKNANILTSWIVEEGTDFPRLTNVYVTRKKVKGEIK